MGQGADARRERGAARDADDPTRFHDPVPRNRDGYL
jgi:hypothetical protein